MRHVGVRRFGMVATAGLSRRHYSVLVTLGSFRWGIFVVVIVNYKLSTETRDGVPGRIAVVTFCFRFDSWSKWL